MWTITTATGSFEQDVLITEDLKMQTEDVHQPVNGQELYRTLQLPQTTLPCSHFTLQVEEHNIFEY